MELATTPTPPSRPITPLTTKNYSHTHTELLHIIKHCKTLSQLKQIHARTLRTTSLHHSHTLFLFSRIIHSSTIINLNYATRVLNHIHQPNSFMWNTIIRAHSWSIDQKHQAIVMYLAMLVDGRVSPDKHTFPFVLKACAFLFAYIEGLQIQSHIVKLGFGRDTYVNNSLVHFYVSCGRLDLAKKVFEEMPERSLVSWNVMIDGYVQFGEFSTALRLFVEVQKLFEPDGFTMQSVLCACTGLGMLSLGMWAHAYILRKCELSVKNDVLVMNSVLDMYCKCGSLEMARQVFQRMSKRDVTSWNLMILGYAMHGRVKEALKTFSDLCMIEGLRPNSITFVGVLSACNHGGLVNEGRMYFDLMSDRYKIEPQVEHYGCVVDLLARAGFITEALDIFYTMPMKPDVVIWRSLLDACAKKNVDIELSEEVAQKIFETDGDVCSGVYVLLSKVYASANRWNDVGLVRKLMGEKGITKEPGCSLIEVDGEIHNFLAGDTSHSCTKEIYQSLSNIEERLKSVGYVPDLSQVLMIDEHSDEKRQSLSLHSERLAIAFGLLNAKPGMPIRVFKNLRVCNDCHSVTKLISSVFDVEIIVRDRARFHHFKDGRCSCRDYW
ncbi:Pentatricopeptide repeat-containing protein [Ranunculus cassubicifolius]